MTFCSDMSEKRNEFRTDRDPQRLSHAGEAVEIDLYLECNVPRGRPMGSSHVRHTLCAGARGRRCLLGHASRSGPVRGGLGWKPNPSSRRHV
jgi:hypothetical protein